MNNRTAYIGSRIFKSATAKIRSGILKDPVLREADPELLTKIIIELLKERKQNEQN